MKVVVAGASGFVGRALLRSLTGEHEVTALARRIPQAAEAGGRVTWRRTDLFSLLDVEQALDGADVGIYLIHSMMPPNRLTQGSFTDLDLILADNFARAARFQGLKRIIYLGGLIPEGVLSLHLESRLEVERVLASQGVPVVSLRAGLIVGPGGSSFQIMERLVRRLPGMVCPAWTTTRCQPVALVDVVHTIKSVVSDQTLKAGAYDLGGPDVLTYVDMMRQLAGVLGLKRYFLNVPFVSPTISRLWVSTVTGASRALVYPLIGSLRHDLIARDTKLQDSYGKKAETYVASLRDALEAAPRPAVSAPANAELAPSLWVKAGDAVTSVQRLPLPSGMTSAGVAEEYARWLPVILKPLIRVDETPDKVLRLCVRGLGWLLLELSFSHGRSSLDRQLYYITGGLLQKDVSGAGRPRLEFRRVPGEAKVLVAVLDFRPRIPWWIYRLTQAKAHLLIMRLFGWHLAKLGRSRANEA